MRTRTRALARRATMLVALTAAGTLALSGIAVADNLINNVTVGGTDTIAQGGSTTIGYRINATGGDDQTGCNASDGSPATVTLNVPAGVTASTTTLVFNACNVFQNVTFSSSSAGNHTISVASIVDSGPGSYKNEANFTLKVTSTNTKPTVAVTGVTHGASYEIGSVPAAGCAVTDAEDGNSTKAAVVTGALSHGLGQQTATCTHTDSGGLPADAASATYTIVDTGAPTIEAQRSPAPNAAGWNNSDVTVSFECADPGGSGVQSCTDSVTLSGEGADQEVTGTATDWAGNSSSTTVSGINIDKTKPTVQLTGALVDGATYYYGFVPAAPGCEASDALSGLDGACGVSGYGAGDGNHTVTATATDRAGNTRSTQLSYTVAPWTMTGFYTPVDGGRVWNTAKGGSTIPLKFQLFAGPTELTDTSKVSLKIAKVTCESGAIVTDAIEVLSSGGTSLRYDAVGGTFIQNWKTPTGAGCYVATMTPASGTPVSAQFKMLK